MIPNLLTFGIKYTDKHPAIGLVGVLVGIVVMGLLSGCDAKFHEQDHKFVCSMDGRAYLVYPSMINVAFVEAMPQANALCHTQGAQ